MNTTLSAIRSGLIFLLLTALWSAPAIANESAGFQINAAETRLVDGVYQLDARIHFSLSDRIIEALHSGVPQVIQIEMRVIRPREYLWSETLAALTQEYQLVYHALSERYVVENFNTTSRNSYPSLGEALYQIGLIHEFPLIDAKLLPANVVCYGKIRAQLDIESLPTPMRLTAYTNRDWWLSSDWVSWPLQ